jgi:uncharacterized protein YndB with AHSA1/START domain
MTFDPPFDPKFDLKIERTIDVPPRLVFEAWTKPEHLMHWFVPKPWSLASAEVEVKAGGKFNFVMKSPEGQEMPNFGCMLEVVQDRKLAWTNCLLGGFRPATPEWGFTGIITFEPTAKGTRYVAMALHATEAVREKHAAMGYEHGWNAALDQLIEHAKTMK